MSAKKIKKIFWDLNTKKDISAFSRIKKTIIA